MLKLSYFQRHTRVEAYFSQFVGSRRQKSLAILQGFLVKLIVWVLIKQDRPIFPTLLQQDSRMSRVISFYHRSLFRKF